MTTIKVKLKEEYGDNYGDNNKDDDDARDVDGNQGGSEVISGQ